MSISLIAFLLVYCAVFGVGYSYLANLIKKGPQAGEGDHTPEGGPGTSHTPSRPLSAVQEKLHSPQEEK